MNSIAVTDSYTLPNTIVLDSILSFQLLENLPQEPILEITLSDFNFSLDLKPLSIKKSSDGRAIKITTKIEEVVSLFVHLEGDVTSDGKIFKVINISLGVELLEQTPQAELIASSLRAALILTKQVQIRVLVIEFDAHLRLNLDLNQISNMLKRCQIAYKLMVIEQATNVKFLLPAFISSNDLYNIDIVYNAIKEKSFTIPVQTLYISVPANTHVFKLLPQDKPCDFSISNDLVEKTILGNNIFLGSESFLIKDAITINFKEVKIEMASNDNHLMQVAVLSLSGKGIYTYPDSPKLSEKPWPNIISRIIDLEQYLDNALATQYNELASATLADLTVEEKEEVSTDSFFA